MELGLKVQGAVYGYTPDPILPSYSEAVQWVCMVIENGHMFTENTDEWRNAVGKEAVAHMKTARNVIAPLLGEKKSTPKNAQSNKGQQSDQNTKPAQQSSNSNQGAQADKNERLSQCLEAIYKNWNNYQVIRNIYTQAKNEGLLDAPVDVDTSGDQPRIVQGGPYSLKAVLSKRGVQLAPAPEPQSQQGSAPAPETSAPNPPAAEPESAPDESPVDAEDFASLAGGEVSEDTSSQDASTPEAQTGTDWEARLKSVVSEADAQSAWTDASESMQETVNYDGESMKLSEAFGKLQEKFGQAQEIVEKAEVAEQTADLNKLRTEANEHGVLEFEVSDGHSDEPKALKDIRREKRESRKSE